MRSFLLRAFVFILLVVLVCTALDALLLHGLRQRHTHTFGTWNRLVEGRIQADVLFTGSSRALMHYDAAAIEKRIGLHCWNIGMDGTQLNLQWPWLKTYLKYNKAPRLIVQEVDLFSFLPDTNTYFPIQYVPYLHEAPIYDALLATSPEWEKNRYVPLYAFGRFGLPVAVLGVTGLLGMEDTVHDPLVQGHERRNWKWEGTFENFVAAHPGGFVQGMEQRGEEVLRGIIHDAKAAGSGIVLVYAPELGEMQKFTLNRDEVMARFNRIAAEEGIAFWDFSGLDLCSDRQYFYNSQHMNSAGVERFTPLVIDSVQAWLAAHPLR